MRLFLDEFAKHGNQTLSAEACGVHRGTAWRWRVESEEHQGERGYSLDYEVNGEVVTLPFHEAWAICEGMARDRLVAEAWRRAVDGWEEPVFQKGEEVGRVKKFDSLLLMFLIKQRDPSFRENARLEVQHSGSVSVDSARDRLAAKLEGLLGQGAAMLPGAAPAGLLDPGPVPIVVMDVSPVGEGEPKA